MRVLIVEDDPVYGRLLGRCLSVAGFECTLATSARDALATALESPPSLLLVDWVLRGNEIGLALIKRIKGIPVLRSLPCVVMTGTSADADDEAAARAAGADFFFTKDEYSGRMKFMIRHLKSLVGDTRSLERSYRIEDLHFQPAAGLLTIGNKTQRFHGKDAALLEIFLRHPNMIHQLNFLWMSVWNDDTEGWRHTLENRISRLRKLLGPRWASRLVARKGVGFILEV